MLKTSLQYTPTAFNLEMSLIQEYKSGRIDILAKENTRKTVLYSGSNTKKEHFISTSISNIDLFLFSENPIEYTSIFETIRMFLIEIYIEEQRKEKRKIYEKMFRYVYDSLVKECKKYKGIQTFSNSVIDICRFLEFNHNTHNRTIIDTSINDIFKSSTRTNKRIFIQERHLKIIKLISVYMSKYLLTITEDIDRDEFGNVSIFSISVDIFNPYIYTMVKDICINNDLSFSGNVLNIPFYTSYNSYFDDFRHVILMTNDTKNIEKLVPILKQRCLSIIITKDLTFLRYVDDRLFTCITDNVKKNGHSKITDIVLLSEVMEQIT